MPLTEQQEGRLAAFIAELGEQPSEDVWREAAAELQRQAPALHHLLFSAGFTRGQEKATKKADALQRELAQLRGAGLPADREVALQTELDQLRSQVDSERRSRVEAELMRTTEQFGLNSTWVANELAAAWRTGTLSFDATGQVEAQGQAPAPGESALAAFARTLKGRCPPELVASRADRGAGTGGDRGAGAGSRVAQFMAETQAARDARPNPLAPATTESRLAAAGPFYASPADAQLKVGLSRLIGQAIEAGAESTPTRSKS